MVATFEMILCIFGGIALGAFLYRAGLMDGLSVQNGESVNDINPVSRVKRVVRKVAQAKADSKEKVAKEKAEAKYLADLAELLSYDGSGYNGTEHTRPGGGVNED